jgi:mannose-6-phosphate isomerase-like protein (cupin superfamily)
MRLFIRAVGVLTLAVTPGLSTPAFTQTPAKPPAKTPAKQAAPRPRPTSMRVVVRDQSGKPVSGVHVLVSGTTRDTTTDATGTAVLDTMRDGSYRLRFEREGFVTLERDVTARNGQPAEILVALSAAPPPPPPSRLEPTPSPTPAPSASSGRLTNVSIPAFLDKNFIGRDPLKESVLGCTAGATTRLLQLRDPLAVHTHANLDEILYVVAGEGAVRMRDLDTVIGAGSLTVIPRGLPHAVERRGKNPLVVISTLAGAPCRAQE